MAFVGSKPGLGSPVWPKPLAAEESRDDRLSSEALVREILLRMGEDPARDGLRRTPERVTQMSATLFSGYSNNLESVARSAVTPTDETGPILMRGVPFFSLCEHHLLPFYGKVNLVYLPDGLRLMQTSISALIDLYAHRLQIQERLTTQIADGLAQVLQPRGIAVQVEGIHLCAVLRGETSGEDRQVTQAFRGIYQSDMNIRRDFYNLICSEKSRSNWPG